MPVVLGLASSHAPFLLSPAEAWPSIHDGLVRGVPAPAHLHTDTKEVIESYLERSRVAFAAMRAALAETRPDALIIIGDDQKEVFSDALIPPFAIFLGEEIEGTASIGWIKQDPADNRIRLKCPADLARLTLDGLMARDFDVGYIKTLTPLARPERGLSHAFTRVAKLAGIAELGIPVIVLFLNAYHPPLPTAARCFALGEALRDIFANRPERIAVYGSGGLSHDPMGPRAGWVDEPLDRWLLERIAQGEGAALKHLFKFDSDSMRGGTGEMRNWIVAAGACDGIKATVLDYIPSPMALAGLAFAYWPEQKA